MKKISLVAVSVFLVLLFSGCSKSNEKDVMNGFSNIVKNNDSYHLEGILEIVNNEENYVYDVNVDYEAEENYRVSLKNQINNHEQIILKNDEGVYVLTPSLNKSFKFQSEWPYNNSQTYLLQTILIDLENDQEKVFETLDNGYVFKAKANYSNNKELVNQQIYLDKNYNLTKVIVLDENNNQKIKMEVSKLDMNPTYNKNYFTLESNMNNNSIEKTTSKTIEDIVYPMYMPTNTKLSSQEKIELENGERAILTFGGDSSFMLIQETISIPESYTTEIVSGDICMLKDTLGVVSETSLNWQSDGIDYYLMSDDLSQEELILIANSLNNVTATSIIK